jgi:hypothetical protein
MTQSCVPEEEFAGSMSASKTKPSWYARFFLSSKHPLHPDDVEPSIKLESDFPKMRDFFKAKRRVKRDAGFLVGADAAKHGVMSEGIGPLD